VAYQAGLLPLRGESIEEAIRLNGVAAERNLEAFRWGRKYQQDPGTVLSLAGERPQAAKVQTPDDLLQRRFRDLVIYQNLQYAEQYRDFVAEVRRAEERARPGSTELSEAVARHLYKLMAYKDEYEVARLLTDPSFENEVNETFESPKKIVFHLHPPLLRAIGFEKKLSLGPWFRPVLRLLAACKGLRGTAFDVFGWTEARRQERALIGWYRDQMRSLLAGLNPGDLDLAVEIARMPDQIRGYEEVKARSIEAVQRVVAEKLALAQQRTAA